MAGGNVLGLLPDGLRLPLLAEYQRILHSFSENRWLPSELSGGRFCEVVFTIVEGFAIGSYPCAPKKPQDFVGACRQLEQNSHVPRSFQILIPRILPAVYEVRNNRGVGHVGGDVNPNYMDSAFVVSSCSWMMGEMIRVLHDVTVGEAQALVDSLAQRRVPLVWEGQNTRRILRPELRIQSQILLFLVTSNGPVSPTDLLGWLDYKNAGYFRTLLRNMHKQRLVELSSDGKSVEILPPGSNEAAEIIRAETSQSELS